MCKLLMDIMKRSLLCPHLRPVASQTDFCRIGSAIYSFIWSNKLNARINLLKGEQNSKACAKSQSDAYKKRIKLKRRQQTDLQ